MSSARARAENLLAKWWNPTMRAADIRLRDEDREAVLGLLLAFAEGERADEREAGIVWKAQALEAMDKANRALEGHDCEDCKAAWDAVADCWDGIDGAEFTRIVIQASAIRARAKPSWREYVPAINAAIESLKSDAQASPSAQEPATQEKPKHRTCPKCGELMAFHVDARREP